MTVGLPEGTTGKMYEDALLGFILADPDKMLEVSETLPTADYFTDPNNRAAYGIFLKLFNQDKFPGSPMLMIDELYAGDKDDKSKKTYRHFATRDEAARYVNALMDAPTVQAKKFNPKAFREYANFIKWERDRKNIISLGQTMLSEADQVSYNEREDFIDEIENGLADITMAVHGKEGLKHISDMTSGLAEQIEMLHSGQKLASGIMTGIDTLDKTLNGLKGGEVCVLAARPGQGKSCLDRSSIICFDPKKNTPYWTTIGDVKVGDYVYNRQGKPVEVLGVYPQGKRDAYELTFSDGRTSICSSDHIWPYWKSTGRHNRKSDVISTMTLQEMMDKGIHVIKPSEANEPTRSNRSRFAMPINDAVEFPERELPLHPYLMGAFLGGGCKNPSGSFILSSEHPEHVARIAEILGADEYRNKKGCYTWSFYRGNQIPCSEKPKCLTIDAVSPAYTNLLSDTDCWDKYIPEEYKLASMEQRWELIRGLMDADGNISQTDGGATSFSTASKQLANDFASVVRSLGLIAHVNSRECLGQTHGTSNGREQERQLTEYHVTLLVPNEVKPKFFSLPHKSAIAEAIADKPQRGSFDRVHLKDVRKLDRQEEMTCLYVDDSEHLFLVDDYLVTHNTTLSMQIAYNVASGKKQDGSKHAVLIFSLEMMEDQLVSRMLATIGRINMQAFMEEYQHFVSDHYYANTFGKAFEEKMERKLNGQYERAQIALDYLDEIPIYPTTESGLSPNSIKSMVMQKKRELERRGEKLSLIVIDYLQLMVPNTGKANASRTEEVGDMSRKMKLLAKEFDVPVLLLAQLNRNSDVTTRPNLKDLRESGSIEQDADKVMFIWSENAEKSANDFSEFKDDNAKREALRREQMKVTISVAKNRQGECGDCPVIFDKGFQTFVSQSDEYGSNESFDEFCEKYYEKTRTQDLFWPLKIGEIPGGLEDYRIPQLLECNYLDPSGTLHTLSNWSPNGDQGRKMSVHSAPARTSSKPELDTARPSQPPIIVDDLQSDFEELDEEDVSTEDAPANAADVPVAEDHDPVEVEVEGLGNADGAADSSSTSIVMDDDDEELDMDELSMMELNDTLNDLTELL